MMGSDNSPPKELVGADLRRILKEVTSEARKNKTPIFIAVLAAFLALVSMAEGDAGRRSLSAHIESSNQFAYFQAKNIRKTDSEIAAQMLEATNRPDLAAKWQERADRYESEKKEILASARKQQDVRKVSLAQMEYFGIAIALLQIAIVLASASLILGGGYLLGTSVVLTLLAAVLTANGYLMFVEFPTDPVAFADWVTGSLQGGTP